MHFFCLYDIFNLLSGDTAVSHLFENCYYLDCNL